MKHLAVANQKGGMGKTTTATSLAADLAGFEKSPGADRRGIVRGECFT